VSRWDRLKGSSRSSTRSCDSSACGRHAASARSGDARSSDWCSQDRTPHSIQDDPEAVQVLEHLSSRNTRLPEALQADIALLALPITSRKHNAALMVNCLQRCSAMVVQNSLAEGFGLTATEAMWKGYPRAPPASGQCVSG